VALSPEGKGSEARAEEALASWSKGKNKNKSMSKGKKTKAARLEQRLKGNLIYLEKSLI